MRSLKHALFGLILVVTSTSARAAEMPASFADMVEKLTPSVVNISSTQKVKGGFPGLQLFGMPEGGENMPPELKEFFDQFSKRGGKGMKPMEREAQALGSGFIIDESGYVVTNNHVIADAEEITVILSDDTKLKAKIIGRDSKTDLALLKVDSDRKLPAVVLGDSDASRVGDWVITIGNPFGLGGTVTAGIISARARNINAGPFDDFIQTDAAINRGNSGGPMFNSKGEVIGINTAIFSPTGGSVGIGFAVPMALAKPIIEQLKSTGKIERGLLGVKIQQVSEEMADSVGLKKPMGALVIEVTKDGPADKAGIKAGDIVTHFDGKEVKEMRFLPRMVAETKVGKKSEVTVWRGGAEKKFTVDIARMTDSDKDAEDADSKDSKKPADKTGKVDSLDVLSLSLAAITPELRAQYDIGKDVKGVVVVDVKDNSAAEKRGFQAGDVIVQVGDATVETPQAVADAVANAKKAGRKFAMVRVQRAETATFETLPLEEKQEEKK